MKIIKLTKESIQDLLEHLLKRSPDHYGEYEGRVNEIVEQVRKRGDEALFEYTKQFDGADIDAETIRVTEAEIKEAYRQTDPSLLEVIRKSLQLS